MSAAIATYRAKADCRAGGFLRRKGETFELPEFAEGATPAHLEKVSARQMEEDSKAAQVGKVKVGKPTAIPKAAQVGKDDIGAGAPTSSADVTSADMVTR